MLETDGLRRATMEAAATGRAAAREGCQDAACHMISALEVALLECCTELDRLGAAIDVALARPVSWRERMWERLGV